MSIIINYPEFSPIAQLPQYFAHVQSGLTLDALDFLFHGLCESSTKLNGQLYNITYEGVFENLSAYKKMRLAMLEAWAIIDAAHRATELMQSLQATWTPQQTTLIEDLKTIRNSYQHLDARIEEHFVVNDNGGSVYGWLSWQYLETAKGDIAPPVWNRLVMVPGFAYNAFIQVGKTEASPSVTDVITNVELEFVVKPRRNQDSTHNIIVSLDGVADLVNKMIMVTEQSAERHLDMVEDARSKDPTRQYGTGFMPTIIRYLS